MDVGVALYTVTTISPTCSPASWKAERIQYFCSLRH